MLTSVTRNPGLDKMQINASIEPAFSALAASSNKAFNPTPPLAGLRVDTPILLVKQKKKQPRIMRPMQKSPGVFHFTPGLFYIRPMYYAKSYGRLSGTLK
jgi:hypothetical protein